MDPHKMHAPGPTRREQILRYLIDHPEAKDSLEGICQWWMTQEGPLPQKQQVQEILNQLIRQGWVIAYTFHETQTIYGLNQAKTEEIRRFLQTGEVENQQK